MSEQDTPERKFIRDSLIPTIEQDKIDEGMIPTDTNGVYAMIRFFNDENGSSVSPIGVLNELTDISRGESPDIDGLGVVLNDCISWFSGVIMYPSWYA